MVLHQEEGYLQRLYLRQVYHPEQMLQVLHIHLGSEICLALYLSDVLLLPVQQGYVLIHQQEVPDQVQML